MSFNAVVSVIFIASAISTEASLYRLFSWLEAVACFNETEEAYLIMGLTTIGYSQYMMSGFIPRIFLEDHLASVNATPAFFNIQSRCRFQFSCLESAHLVSLPDN